MRALELRVPPVASACVAGLTMWLISWTMPTFGFSFPARKVVAASLAIAGAVTSALGVLSFRRARTTVNPLKPESSAALVVTGVYTLSRNPMYLGFLAVLAGWSVFFQNALAFLLVPAWVLFIQRFQIEPEERALAAIFGEQFAAYKARVRAWL